jgi:hypothetical protein
MRVFLSIGRFDEIDVSSLMVTLGLCDGIHQFRVRESRITTHNTTFKTSGVGSTMIPLSDGIHL